MSQRRQKAMPAIRLGPGSPSSYKHSLLQEDPVSPPSHLAFDNSLLSAYKMNDMTENTCIVNLIQTMYYCGNDSLKSGLSKLVSTMAETAAASNTMNRELNEKHQKISELETHITGIETTAESKIGILEEEITEGETKYAKLSDMVSEMSSRAAMTDQLQHDKSQLQAQINALETQLHLKRKRMDELSGAEATVKQVNRVFNNDGHPIQFPVIQENGVIMDLCKVILAWTKNSNEDDDHPYRNYTCPVTKTPTSLARIGIIAKIQELALNLGRDITPPIEFEFKNSSDRWTKFGLMDQLRIIAKLSCMYFNKIATSAIMVKNDQICFDIRLEKIKEGSFSLKCNAQNKRTPVDLTVRINLDGPNLFPEITSYL